MSAPADRPSPVVIALAFLVASALPVWAQAEESQPPRWTVMWLLGASRGGPAAAIEAAMNEEGFGDTRDCVLFCEGVVEHPFSRNAFGDGGGPSWLVSVSYRRDALVSFSAMLSSTEIGTTFGYRTPASSGEDDFLFVEYGVLTVAPLVVLTPSILRLELGPAVHRTAAWRGDRANSTTTELRHRWTPGLVVGAGLWLPLHRSLAVQARAQYRYVWKGVVGPYETLPAAFPEVEAAFSHLFAALGLSLHL